MLEIVILNIRHNTFEMLKFRGGKLTWMIKLIIINHQSLRACWAILGPGAKSPWAWSNFAPRATVVWVDVNHIYSTTAPQSTYKAIYLLLTLETSISLANKASIIAFFCHHPLVLLSENFLSPNISKKNNNLVNSKLKTSRTISYFVE